MENVIGGTNASAHILCDQMISRFTQVLSEHEKSNATIEKYTRDVETFLTWNGEDKQISKEKVILYKQHLQANYKLTSANSMLSALNTFLKYNGWNDCCVATFKTQHTAFRSTQRDLSIEEYHRLLCTANSKKGRGIKGARQIALIMETLATTGIRVSELPFITVASLATRHAVVTLKGKTRQIILPAQLCKKLRAYCREKAITAGTIFITASGRPIDRSNILHRMKALSQAAGVLRDKIFPHNLRRLFAVTYYQKEKDIARLADILGHSNINTTRIYTLVSWESQIGVLDQLGDLLALP